MGDAMIKRLGITCSFAYPYTQSLFAASYTNFAEAVPIVRFLNIDDVRIGRFTFLTQNSYVSLWSKNPVTLEKLDSLAICLTTHQKNMEKERKEADIEYTIALESNNGDTLFNRILQAMGDGRVADSEHPIFNVTCFGSNGLIIPEPNEGQAHLNCASAILLALKSGGINIYPILSSIKSAQDLTRASAAIAQSKTALLRKVLR